jgi:8-oxo-dGTP pyrophosphatase MutT (NUDIX family)
MEPNPETKLSPIATLSLRVPIATTTSRESIGIVFPRFSLGETYILLVKQPYAYIIKDLCYLFATWAGKDVDKQLAGYLKELAIDEYKLLLDPFAFQQVVEKVYYAKTHMISKVINGYKALLEKMKSFPCSGRNFESGWSLPKGGAEADETRGMTLTREVSQETGLKCGMYLILPVEPFKYDLIVSGYLFTSQIYFGELDQTVIFPTKGASLAPTLQDMVTKPTASHEISEVQFVPLREVPKLLPAEAWEALKPAMMRYMEYKIKSLFREIT